jgi:hypothetical protein
MILLTLIPGTYPSQRQEETVQKVVNTEYTGVDLKQLKNYMDMCRVNEKFFAKLEH